MSGLRTKEEGQDEEEKEHLTPDEIQIAPPKIDDFKDRGRTEC